MQTLKRLYKSLALLLLIGGITVMSTPVNAVSSSAPTVDGYPAQQAPDSLQNSADKPDTLSGSKTPSPIDFYDWVGYSATATSFSKVVGSYVQPSISCTTPLSWDLFWVGFDGYNTNTVE